MPRGDKQALNLLSEEIATLSISGRLESSHDSSPQETYDEKRNCAYSKSGDDYVPNYLCCIRLHLPLNVLTGYVSGSFQRFDERT
jgi:hypothetical protein